MNPQSILVTGGLGFQGLNIVKQLVKQGRSVTVLNTPSPRARMLARELQDCDVRIVWGSITDQEVMEKIVPGHDGIIHLAAWASVDQSLQRPWPAFEINTLGAITVLEAIRQFAEPNARVIIASTCEVYGPVRRPIEGMPYIPQHETTPMMPRSPYAATKVAQDRLAYAHAIAYDMNLTILRPCNVFGPWQRYGSFGAVIPSFVRNALHGEPLYITGGGQQRREFIYIDDLVDAYIATLDGTQSVPGEAFNVGTGEIRSIRHVAEAVAKILNARIEHSSARVADVSGFLLDSKRFHSVFGWNPLVSFDDGLVDYIDWVRSRGGEG